MQLDVRPEVPADEVAIRAVVRAAFGHHESVVDLVDLIRESPGFVPELSLVARRSETVLGHVMLSRAELVEDGGARHDVLILSPLGVAPADQRQGIGGTLVRAGLAVAEAHGASVGVRPRHPRQARGARAVPHRWLTAEG